MGQIADLMNAGVRPVPLKARPRTSAFPTLSPAPGGSIHPIFGIPEAALVGTAKGVVGLAIGGLSIAEQFAPEERPYGIPVSTSDFRKMIEERKRFLQEDRGIPRSFGELAEEPKQALNFIVEKTAEVLPSIAAFMAGGAPATALKLGEGAALASGIGLFSILTGGEVYAEAIHEGRSPEVAAKLALAVGIPSAALDGIFFSKVGGRLVATNLEKAVVAGLLTSKQTLGQRALAKEALAAGFSDAALFAGLSGTKEIANAVSESIILDENIVPRDVAISALNAAAEGALVGGVIGAGFQKIGLRRGVRQEQENIPGVEREDLRREGEKDLTEQDIKKLAKVDGPGEGELPAPRVGTEYTLKNGDTLTVTKVEPNKATLETGVVVERRLKKAPKRKLVSRIYNTVAEFNKVVKGAEKVELARAAPVPGIAEIVEGLGARSSEVIERLIDGEGIAVIAKDFPKGALENIEKLARNVRIAERELAGAPEKVVKGKKRVKKTGPKFDPGVVKPVVSINTERFAPKASVGLEKTVAKLVNSGRTFEEIQAELVKGTAPGTIADAVKGKLGLDRGSLVRGINFIGERMKAAFSYPRDLVVDGMEIPDTVSNRVLYRLGLVSDSVEMLVQGRGTREVAQELDRVYKLDMTLEVLTQRIEELKRTAVDRDQKVEFPAGDYAAQTAEGEAAVQRNARGQARPHRPNPIRAQDEYVFIKGEDFEVAVSPNQAMRLSDEILVSLPNLGMIANRIKLPTRSLVPERISLRGADTRIAAEKAIQDYFSDFSVDTIKPLPPVRETLPAGVQRLDRFTAFGRKVDVLGSIAAGETSTIRIREIGGRNTENVFKARRNLDLTESRQFVEVIIDGPVKQLQHFAIAKLAEGGIRNRLHDFEQTAAGSIVRITGSAEARKIYEERVRGNPAAERLVDRTVAAIEQVRQVLIKTVSKVSHRERESLRNKVLSTDVIINGDVYGQTRVYDSLVSRLAVEKGEAFHSSVTVNPFINLIKGEAISARAHATRIVETIIHELAHVDHMGSSGADHGLDFHERHTRFQDAISDSDFYKVQGRILKEIISDDGRTIREDLNSTIQAFDAEARKRISQRDAEARTETLAERSADTSSFAKEDVADISDSGERSFWKRKTGREGEDLDRFVRMREEYEEHLREVYKGSRPEEISTDFKDFAESRGFERDTVDGGNAAIDVEGLRPKRMMDLNQAVEPEQRKRVAVDVDLSNDVTRSMNVFRRVAAAKLLPLREFTQGSTFDKVFDYLGLAREGEKQYRTFMEPVSELLIGWSNVGPKQGAAITGYMQEMTIESSRLKRKLTLDERVALGKKHGLNQLGARITRDYEGALEVGKTRLRESLESSARQEFATDSEGLANRIKTIEADFAQWNTIDYFPLKRFGRYVVRVDKPREGGSKVPDIQTAEHFETRKEQLARFAELQREFPKSKGFKTEMEDIGDVGIALMGFPPVLLDSIRNTLSLSEVDVRRLRTLMVSMNPGSSWLKSQTKRHNIPGFSRDGQRSAYDYFNSMARYIGREQTGRGMERVVGEAEAVVRELDRAGDTSNIVKVRRIEAKYLRDHLEYTKNPGNELSALRGGLYKFYMAYVPKTAIVEMTQVPLFAYPSSLELKSIRGNLSVLEMTKIWAQSYRDIASAFDIGRVDHFDVLGKRISPGESNMWTELKLEGLLTGTMARMMVGRGEQNRIFGPLGEKGRAVDRVIHAIGELGMEGKNGAEEIGRRVTSLAVFRAVTHTKNGGNFAKGLERARFLTEETMFNYSPWNKIPLGRGKKGIALLLRSFNIFATNFYFGGRGRWLHRAMMAGIGGVAGGIPAGNLILGLLDQAEREQVEKRIMEYSAELGMRPSSLLHGISHSSFGLPAAFQLFGGNFPAFDLTPSLGMGDIVPGTDPLGRIFEGSGGASALGRFGLELGGPGAQLAWNVATAAVDNNPRSSALRQLAPIGVQNWLKARDIVNGAAVTRTGNEILKYDVSNPMQAAETMGQALGFRPTIIADVQEVNYLQKEYEVRIAIWKESLLGRYALDRDNGEDLSGLTREIRVYNGSVPASHRITREILAKSLEERARRAELRYRGLPSSKRFQRTIQAEFGAIRRPLEAQISGAAPR